MYSIYSIYSIGSIYVYTIYYMFLSQNFRVLYQIGFQKSTSDLVRLDDFREMQRVHPNFAALLGGTGAVGGRVMLGI